MSLHQTIIDALIRADRNRAKAKEAERQMQTATAKIADAEGNIHMTKNEERDKILPHPITIRETSNGGFIVSDRSNPMIEPVKDCAYSDPVDLFHALMQRFGLSKHDLFPEREGEPQSDHALDAARFSQPYTGDQWSKDEIAAAVASGPGHAMPVPTISAEYVGPNTCEDEGDGSIVAEHHGIRGATIRLRRIHHDKPVELDKGEEILLYDREGSFLWLTTQTPA